MTCDGYDIIARNINLPSLEVGDWLLMLEWAVILMVLKALSME